MKKNREQNSRLKSFQVRSVNKSLEVVNISVIRDYITFSRVYHFIQYTSSIFEEHRYRK
jgi:hypothetical protein